MPVMCHKRSLRSEFNKPPVDLATCTPQQRTWLAEAIKYRWSLHARPNQLPPEDDIWRIWMLLTGRGWGKNRTASETINKWVQDGTYSIIHIVTATASDYRDVVAEGISGIVQTSPPHFRAEYFPSKRRIEWPNGAFALLFSAEEPDRLRGPQCEAWYADEMAAWRYLQETWDNLQFGARLGNNVRGIIGTTPRPLKLIKERVADPLTHVTYGHTFENQANLADSFIQTMKEKYEGTRLGRQELAGQVLTDNPLALWKREEIDKYRVKKIPDKIRIVRSVTALDPSTLGTGDEAGIMTVAKGSDGHFYLISDDTIQGSPKEWADQTVMAYYKYRSSLIIYEKNQGGDMVKQTLINSDSKIIVKGIHASKGKYARAEPISLLAESGKLHHVGSFPELEDELCEWDPDTKESPNRLDALVWAVSRLSRGMRVHVGSLDRAAIGA